MATTTTTTTTTIGAMEQEWRHIQQEEHLPRKIERYHDFQERFQHEHTAHLAQCDTYEQRLRDSDGASPSGAGADDEPDDAGASAGASISELWALLTTVERDILTAVKAADAGDVASARTSTSDDPLERAFMLWSQYETICAQLQQRFAGSLNVVEDAHNSSDSTPSATIEPSPAVVARGGVRRSRRRTTTKD